jgi:hypothetical protein
MNRVKYYFLGVWHIIMHFAISPLDALSDTARLWIYNKSDWVISWYLLSEQLYCSGS